MDYLFAGEAAGGGAGGGGYWQLILIAAAIALLGLFSRWRRARNRPSVTLTDLREIDEHPDLHRTQSDKAIVELLETSRVLNAQVDVKIRMLNRLLKQGGELADRLEQLIAAGEGMEEAGFPEDDPEMESGTEARATADPESPPPAEHARPTELQERILRLRSEGKTIPEIARMTDLSITEVSLALDNLRNPAENDDHG